MVDVESEIEDEDIKKALLAKRLIRSIDSSLTGRGAR